MHQFSVILTIKHHVPTGTVSPSSPYMPRLLPNPNLTQNREESGPAFNTAHLFYHFLNLRKIMKYIYAQALIKSKCTMSVTESVWQIAKHLYLRNALRFI